MFRLLSKESNIFSVPVYIMVFLFIVIFFNIVNISALNIFSAVTTFIGISLGYFLFNQLALNYKTHLPLFLYTFIVVAFYPGDLDIGIAVSLFTNSFLLLVFTSENEAVRHNSYLIVGSILAINYIFLPTTWPLFFFVIIHLLMTANRIGLSLVRFFLGILLIFSSYFGMMYLKNYTTFNPDYLPTITASFQKDFYPIYFILPVLLFLLYSIVDHFKHFNQKSPFSKFKYAFLLSFLTAQVVTVIFYMGKNYEYLLLLAFPASVIISRGLRFLPRYWMKELGLWVIVLSLIVFKVAQLFNINELTGL